MHSPDLVVIQVEETLCSAENMAGIANTRFHSTLEEELSVSLIGLPDCS